MVFNQYKKRFTAILTAALLLVLSAFVPVYSASAANLNSTIYYAVFDGDGYGLDSYYLSPVSAATGDAVSPAYVIGDDTREVDFSKSGVVKIVIGYGETSESTTASGFVVDEHTIATAAHCVYDKYSGYSSGENYSGFPIKSIMLFGSDNDSNATPEMTITDVLTVQVPKYYIQVSNSTITAAYDYALITVEEDLSDYMCFNLGYMMDDADDASDVEVSVTGFPSTVDGQSVNTLLKHTMYTGTGNVVGINSNKIEYDADTSGGNSGGPVYVTTTYNNKTYYTVVAVHTSGLTNGQGEIIGNCGTQMNTNLLQFYLSNPYADISYYQ